MRADGIRLKKANPMYTVAAYIMNKRNDALNMIELNIPVAPLNSYVQRKHKEGVSFTHLGIVIAAYLRTVVEYPHLNRFIANKKVYARNEFTIGMVVLKPGETDGTMNKMYFEPTDTVYDVHRKLFAYIDSNRKTGDTNTTDKAVNILLRIPGLINFGVAFVKFADRYGLLPKAVINASPFHASMTISNLASIRTNHIYHHCYNFGTTGILITMGNQREVPKSGPDGIVFERCLPLGVVMDERIASGSYFAMAFKRMKTYLKNPELLEAPPETMNLEFDYEKELKKRQKKQLKKEKKDAKNAAKASKS